MLKKKIMLGAVSAMTLFSLTACGGSKDIATMKGGKITVDDFYNRIKSQQNSQNTVRNMIMADVFDKKYGDKVKESEITKQFNALKKQYGSQFKSALKQAGLTEADFKKQIRQQLALEKGLEAHIKLTDKDLKTAWTSFHPEVSAQIIVLDDKTKADEVLKEVKAEGADFAKIAKEKSTDTATKSKGGNVKFDSTSDTVPTNVQTAAFSLKDGEVSEIITYSDQQTYQSKYYIVKMVKNKAKGNSMKPYTVKLKEIAKKAKMQDTTFVTETVAKELKEANVKIQDSAFSDVLAQYMGTSSSSSSKKKASSKSSTKSSSSSSSSSSEEASSSSATETSSSTEAPAEASTESSEAAQ